MIIKDWLEDFNLEIYEWNELSVKIIYKNKNLDINFYKYKNSYNFDENATIEDVIYFLKSRIATGIEVSNDNLINYLKETKGILMIDTIRLNFLKNF